jgi:hypothetical protein
MTVHLCRWAAALAHFDRERDERSRGPDTPDGEGEAPAVSQLSSLQLKYIACNFHRRRAFSTIRASFCEMVQVVAVKATVDVSGSMQVWRASHKSCVVHK